MPALAGHPLRRLIGVDDHHLRVAIQPRVVRMCDQLAEVSAETHLRLHGNVLLAEEDHLVGNQSIVDLSQPRLIDRVEVDSVNLSAQDRRKARNG